MNDPNTLRISIDAKATIKLGEFSRRGRSRTTIKAFDHDFSNDQKKVHLLGIYLPELKESYLFFLPETQSLTADSIADCLELFFEEQGHFMNQIDHILINLDNGPENHSGRRQFIKRLVEMTDHLSKKIELAYYPPYHSKYNPIERIWGVLEQHWNGTLLVDLETVVEMAKSMTYGKEHPIVRIVDKFYKRGVTVSDQVMQSFEQRLKRKSGIEKYALTITPS